MEEPLTFFALIRQCLLWDSAHTRLPRDLAGEVLRLLYTAAPPALPAPPDEQEPRPP